MKWFVETMMNPLSDVGAAISHPLKGPQSVGKLELDKVAHLLLPVTANEHYW